VIEFTRKLEVWISKEGEEYLLAAVRETGPQAEKPVSAEAGKVALEPSAPALLS